MVEIKVNVDTSDLDKICSILCKSTNCVNNLKWKGIASCNLKNITVTENGICKYYEKKCNKEEVKNV